MTPDSRSKSILLRALETPVGLRQGLVRDLCGDDADLRLEIEELLRYETGDDHPFTEAAAGETELTGTVGTFEIERLLGRGGMGEVYYARSIQDGRHTALKVLRWCDTSPERRRRFNREAAALGRLDHPGIARLEGSGVLSTPEGPLPYLAMEYVEGRSLREVIRGERWETWRLLTFLSDLASILAEAHAQGVVHRDLKPENIIVDPDGNPRVLDFGVARLERDGTDSRTLATRVGQIIGTLQYMSPEQAASDGRPVDGRADIYSLGVIAYEWLTGRPPYPAHMHSFHQAMVQILTVVPPRLGQVDPSLAGDIDRIVARCLAKMPENRYASATELAEDIRHHLAGEPLQSWRPISGDRPAGGDSIEGLSAIASTRGRLLGLASVVVVLCLTVWTAFMSTRQRPSATATIATYDWPTFFAALTSADRKIQRSGHTETAVREGLAILNEAERRFHSLPQESWTSRVAMFMHWRQGEAHLFLSDLQADPDELVAARSAWDLAMTDAQQPGSLADLDSTLAILPEIGRLGRHHPFAGHAGIHVGLAEYRNRTDHLENAINLQNTALAVYDDPTRPNYDPTRGPVAHDRGVDRAMLLADAGGIWALSGMTLEQESRISTGLTFLRRADSAWVYKEYHSPYGAFLHNYGKAYRFRGEMGGRVADLDSAEVWFLKALEVRTAAETVRGYADTKLEQARVSLARMRFEPDPARRSRHFDRGIRLLTAAREVLTPENHSIEIAWLNVLESELRACQAEMSPKGAPSAALRVSLDRADSLVMAAGTAITRDRFAMQRSRFALAMGAVGVARWRTLEDRACRDRAWGEIQTALEGTPRTDDLHLRRQLEELAAELSRDITGSAGSN